MERYNKATFPINHFTKKFYGKYNVHSNSVDKVSDIIATFDIETTSTYAENQKIAFMYEWSFCLLDDKHEYTCYGRTWQEFREMLEQIKRTLLLGKSRKMIIWVHNLSFEFQYMRMELDGEWNVFAGDERKPYKAEIGGFIFRDTLILSAMPLSKVADNLTQHKIKKLVGDLDYSLIRTSDTPMSTQELAYCENDVLIVAYYIAEQKAIYGALTRIPLTNTGRVRQFVKQKCLHTSTTHRKDSKGKRNRYVSLMQECKLSVESYKMLLMAFQGGFTHANPCYSGLTVDNVHSIDFTSSYPAVMLSEKFPMSKPIEIVFSSKTEFEKCLTDDDVGMIFAVTFYNLQATTIYENYLSESKALQIENVISNNGRVFSADSATYVITDVDYSIIRQCYKWEGMTIGKSYTFYMAYLPKSIIESILELYVKKTTLKGVAGKETEYLVSKGMLNSVYGMCVTSIVRDENIYSEYGWSVKEADFAEQINKYNNNKQRCLYYPWGVWVTAYARRNLWQGIFAMADDYIYSDTDSIKFLQLDKHEAFIQSYNATITRKIEDMLAWYRIDYATPATIKGEEKPIGVWDYEGMYDKFKTLGAKRYMYIQDDKLHITIAGLSKKQGRDYIARQDKPFEFFGNAMYIPADFTGKMTHTYIDDTIEADIIDYQGVTSRVKVKSGVHLEPAEFTMIQANKYLDFLQALRQGYLLEGIE